MLSDLKVKSNGTVSKKAYSLQISCTSFRIIQGIVSIFLRYDK